MWKKAVVAYFEVIYYRHFPGGIGKNHDKCQG
jgi:hypothetical protein